MRQDLLPKLRQLFARAGYFVSDETDLRPMSFDFVARRDGDLVVVKVLANVDGLSEPVARELRALAKALSASPLAIGERSSSRELADGAIYMRHGVPILSVGSVEEWLSDGTPPLVYAAPGGFYVTLDGEKMRRLRVERAVSLGQLADAAGVSRRAIAMYEEGMGAMVDVAERLEDFFNEALVRPVDPLRAADERHEAIVDLDKLAQGLERDALGVFAALGFSIVPLARTPMNAVTRSADETVLTGIPSGESEEIARRARAVANLSAIAETHAAFIVARKTTRVAIEGTPVVAREELMGLHAAEELVRLIEARRGKRR